MFLGDLIQPASGGTEPFEQQRTRDTRFASALIFFQAVQRGRRGILGRDDNAARKTTPHQSRLQDDVLHLLQTANGFVQFES